jgi:heme exporter protein D
MVISFIIFFIFRKFIACGDFEFYLTIAVEVTWHELLCTQAVALVRLCEK